MQKAADSLSTKLATVTSLKDPLVWANLNHTTDVLTAFHPWSNLSDISTAIHEASKELGN